MVKRQTGMKQEQLKVEAFQSKVKNKIKRKAAARLAKSKEPKPIQIDLDKEVVYK